MFLTMEDSEFGPDFGDLIAEAVIRKYNELPKGGKPNATEWTILAGIVAIEKTGESPDARLAVVSIGTGTKCLGPSKLCCKGQVLNDSHGEVLARRAFIRAVHWQLDSLVRASSDGTTESSKSNGLFEWAGASDDEVSRQFRLRNNVSLHLYVSQTPCGDASIFELAGGDAGGGDSPAHAPPPKRIRISTDDHRPVEITDWEQRTGAKPLEAPPTPLPPPAESVAAAASTGIAQERGGQGEEARTDGKDGSRPCGEESARQVLRPRHAMRSCPGK